MKKYLICKSLSGAHLYFLLVEDPKNQWFVSVRDDGWACIYFTPRDVINANGRLVTLDHEPTPAEVRTLLEGPDPLSECLELLETAKGYVNAVVANCDADAFTFRNHARVLKRIEALLEKYREGGK